MKQTIRNLLVQFLFMLFCITTKAQLKNIEDIRKELKAARARFPGKQPIYSVNKILITSLKHIDSTFIVRIKAIPASKAIKIYGKKVKNGVIEIEISNEEPEVVSGSKTEIPILEKELYNSPVKSLTAIDELKTTNDIIEELPKYTGNMEDHIKKHLRYPIEALDTGIQGTVLIEFIIELDSTVTNCSVSGDSYTKEISLITEAIRVIQKTSKNWIPGKRNGKPVRTYFWQSINFTIP